MEVSKLYKSNRGLQTQTVGFIVKGATASVQILGSDSMPATEADLVDLTDAQLLDQGSWTFAMVPQYIYFIGTADWIGSVGMNFVEIDLPSTWGN
jgi:hypothetical protein